MPSARCAARRARHSGGRRARSCAVRAHLWCALLGGGGGGGEAEEEAGRRARGATHLRSPRLREDCQLLRDFPCARRLGVPQGARRGVDEACRPRRRRWLMRTPPSFSRACGPPRTTTVTRNGSITSTEQTPQVEERAVVAARRRPVMAPVRVWAARASHPTVASPVAAARAAAARVASLGCQTGGASRRCSRSARTSRRSAGWRSNSSPTRRRGSRLPSLEACHGGTKTLASAASLAAPEEAVAVAVAVLAAAGDGARPPAMTSRRELLAVASGLDAFCALCV